MYVAGNLGFENLHKSGLDGYVVEAETNDARC